MRLKFEYLKVLCLAGLALSVWYLLAVRTLDHGARRSSSTRYTSQKLETLDFDRDIKVQESGSDTGEKTIVWAILGGQNSWMLDILLESLRGTGVILVAQGAKLADTDDVLLKHHINSLYAPNDCYATETMRKSCLKTNWIWLMRQSWSLTPDIVCFTTENVALHPHAISFISEHVQSALSGLKLSSVDDASPWCFTKNVWTRILAEQERFCSMEEYGWEESLAHLNGLSMSSKNSVVVPSQDLAMKIECDGDCSNIHREKLAEKVKAFQTEGRSSADYSSGRFGSEESLSEAHSTWTENAQCRGSICEAFQFRPTDDERVYRNLRMDGKGDYGYMIDLGPTCIDRSKIHISRGGEKVTDVLGRAEKEEFPQYQRGAFQVFRKPPQTNTRFYQSDVIRSATVSKEIPREYDVPGTTLAYTRDDYANVCFVLNDLFNFYITREHVSAKNMLLLDGHALGNLDDVAPDFLDMEITRVGHLSGRTCFERLVLIPRRYLLYYVEKLPNCDLSDFVQKMWQKFGIFSSKEKHDTVILREYYLSHPRVGTEVSRKFSDKDLENIREKLPNAKFVRFHELSWKEQLQTIANTRTLYGMHGAGLILGVFLDKQAKMVEWTHPSRTSTLTFPNLMTWRPDVNFRRLSLQNWLNEFDNR